MSTTWRNVLIGAVILCLIIIGGLLWYIFLRPAPKTAQPTATTTPIVAATTSIPAAAPAEPIHIIQHGTYYDVDMQYPSATPLASTAGASADKAAVETLKNFSENQVQSFIANGKFDSLTAEEVQDEGLGPNQKFALSDGYVSYTGDHTLSYAFNIYELTLGAHPLTTYQTFTFDSQTGQNLALADLFNSNSNYLNVLSSLSKSALTTEEGSNADPIFIDAGTSANASNFQDFAIDGSSLVLIFPPYKVGPGGIGTQTIRIPLSQLSTILNSKYQ